MQDLVFTSLDQLTVVKLIASGSFAKTYLVKDQQGNFYAMKSLNKVKMIMFQQTENVRREIEILRQTKNAYIAKYFGAFQDQQHIYVVLEFVPGGELFYHLRKAEKFDTETTRFYLAELSVALGYLHDQLHVIYRDLKPENALLDKKGHLRLIDFGFAKQTQQDAVTLLGTPEYVAPEIIAQTGHNKAADWWAFGVLAYELLCGIPPFYDDDINNIYRKIQIGTFEFPPGLDPDAMDLITQLLNPDRNARLGANLISGTTDIKSHPFFKGVNWKHVEKRLVKPLIVPDIKSEQDLEFWKEAAELCVEDEEEIREMAESGGGAAAPATQEGIDALFAWL